MTNNEIVNANIDLIQRCVDCQFSKVKDKQFKDDFLNDLVIILLTYDNDKLNDAVRNNHLNALITAIIRNNIYSNTSPYYRDYYRFQNRTDEITEEEMNIADED